MARILVPGTTTVIRGFEPGAIFGGEVRTGHGNDTIGVEPFSSVVPDTTRDMMSDRLSLRPTTEDDLPVFFEHEQDTAAVHMAAFTPKDPLDRDAFMAHWHRLLESEIVIKRSILLDTEVVGHIASWEQDGDREVTYWIDRKQWGKGVATTALHLFLDEVTTRPLYARAAKDNVASIRVLEKAGFEVIGQERGYANAREQQIDELVLRLPSDTFV